jgi:hypothetical protein
LRWNDLTEAMKLDTYTGNALFDEFWFYWQEDAMAGAEGY